MSINTFAFAPLVGENLTEPFRPKNLSNLTDDLLYDSFKKKNLSYKLHVPSLMQFQDVIAHLFFSLKIGAQKPKCLLLSFSDYILYYIIYIQDAYVNIDLIFNIISGTKK